MSRRVFRVIKGGRFRDGRIKGGRQRWASANGHGARRPRGNGLLRFSGLWLGAILVGTAGGYALYALDQPERAEAAEELSQTAESESVWAAGPPRFEAASENEDAAESETDEAAADSGAFRAQFGFCHTGGGTNCVVDGDTLWLQGQKIRIADIDAPETHDYRCPEEKALGDRATRRLQQLVNSGSVTLSPIDRDEDRYGRKLRIVMVDGMSVGDTLVGEGLARWYEGGRRPWC